MRQQGTYSKLVGSLFDAFGLACVPEEKRLVPAWGNVCRVS